MQSKTSLRPVSSPPIYSKIQKYIVGLEAIVPDENRRILLEKVAAWIVEKKERRETPSLNFICTHNSRRSQLAQIWMATLADYYGVENIHTYSGGTEVTQFNPRAVAALERAGFIIDRSGRSNPQYAVYAHDEQPPLVCFSKTFDDAENPQENFAAVMVCSDADENCPIVLGASIRVSLPFDDPKDADDTASEKKIYDLRCREIAAEMKYIIQKVRNND